MYARVTSFEIDPVRIAIPAALERFKESVLPELRRQPGFKALQVLETPEGQGLLITFWEGEEAAQRGIETGYYDEQVSKLVMFMKQPPGRDHYEVVFSEGIRLIESQPV